MNSSSSTRLTRANTSTVTEDLLEIISSSLAAGDRERPSSSPVPRTLTRYEDFEVEDVRIVDFHKSEHVLSSSGAALPLDHNAVALDDEDDDDEEEDEDDDDDDEEEESEEDEDDLIDNTLETGNNDNKLSVAVAKSPTKSSKTQPSASSTLSSNSNKSVALPPLTHEQLNKSRYVIGSTTFFDSFFGTDELDRYFPDHKLRLSILTWNMSSKPPENYSQALQDMLIPRCERPKTPRTEELSEQENLPEVFVIGLQETPKSEVVVTNIKVGIQAVLGPNYALLQWSAMGVLHASVWIRRELLWSCTSVDTVSIHSRPTAANRIKTKGAVAMSLSLFGTSFLFINTHLSAHENNLRTRINQLDKVQQTLNLKVKESQNTKGKATNSKSGSKERQQNQQSNHVTATTDQITDVDKKAHKEKDNKTQTRSARSNDKTTEKTSNSSNRSSRKGLKHSEYVFWFGDLNFRIELPSEHVLQSIRDISSAKSDEQRLQLQHRLMRSDQLTNLMDRGMIFDGYREAIWPPPFLPTYKWRPLGRHVPNGGAPLVTNHNRNTNSNSDSNSSSPTPSIMSSVSSITTNSSNNSRSVPHNLNTLVTTTTTGTSSSSASTRELVANLDNNNLDNNPQPTFDFNYNSSRVPSFTDRILYQSRLVNGDTDPYSTQIKCHHYLSVPSITSSDHKPVYGLFEVRLDSGGPRIPFRLKKFTQMVSNGIKSKVNLTRENSFDTNNTVPSSSSSSIPSTSKGNYSFFGRKLGRNKRGKGSINEGLQASAQALQSISMSSLPTSSSLARLDKLTRLNAGAFERQIFIDGLRLRNSLMASYTVEEFKERHNFGLFKSRSFDSNVIEQTVVLNSNNSHTNLANKTNQHRSNARTHKQSHSSYSDQEATNINKNGSQDAVNNANPKQSSICLLM